MLTVDQNGWTIFISASEYEYKQISVFLFFIVLSLLRFLCVCALSRVTYTFGYLELVDTNAKCFFALSSFRTVDLCASTICLVNGIRHRCYVPGQQQ